MVRIWYHAPCYDGFGAAFAAWVKYGNTAEYTPVSYGKPLPEINLTKDDELYIVDFSYPKDVLVQLNARVKKLIVLDHHMTAQKDLSDLPYAYFDMDRSGATMSWDYFHGAETRPLFFDYLQDRDLWTYKLPNSLEVSSALRSYPFDFQTWKRLLDGGEQTINVLASQGKTILAHTNTLIANRAKDAFKFTWTDTNTQQTYRVACVEATEYFSEVAHYLVTHLNVDIGMYYMYDAVKDAIKIGTRSEGDIDTTHLTRSLGGGGHKHASGANMPLSTFRTLISAK